MLWSIVTKGRAANSAYVTSDLRIWQVKYPRWGRPVIFKVSRCSAASSLSTLVQSAGFSHKISDELAAPVSGSAPAHCLGHINGTGPSFYVTLLIADFPCVLVCGWVITFWNGSWFPLAASSLPVWCVQVCNNEATCTCDSTWAGTDCSMPDPPKQPETTKDEGPKGRFPPLTNSGVWQNESSTQLPTHVKRSYVSHQRVCYICSFTVVLVTLLDWSQHRFFDTCSGVVKTFHVKCRREQRYMCLYWEDEMNTQVVLYTWYMGKGGVVV